MPKLELGHEGTKSLGVARSHPGGIRDWKPPLLGAALNHPRARRGLPRAPATSGRASLGRAGGSGGFSGSAVTPGSGGAAVHVSYPLTTHSRRPLWISISNP